MAGEAYGLTSGLPKINVYQRGEILLYSYLDDYLDFLKIGARSVYNQGAAACVNIPNKWILKHNTSDLVRVYYTKDGLFVRPYHVS